MQCNNLHSLLHPPMQSNAYFPQVSKSIEGKLEIKLENHNDYWKIK